MKTFFAIVYAVLVTAFLLLPIFIVLAALLPGLAIWIRIILACTGLLLCRIAKPLSTITGKDFKII